MRLSAYSRLATGESYLHRMDGRIKTVVLLAAIVTVSLLTRWPLAAGTLAVAWALIFTLRLSFKRILLRLSVPFGVAWLVLLSLMFTTGHTVLGTARLGQVALHVYREGALLGFLIMLRILAAVSLAMLLSFSTPMGDILATLRLLKAPGLILDLADMIYRYVFLIEETAVTMRKAQRARGGEGLSWRRQARDMGIVAGNLLIKAFDRSLRIYKAMLARGYDEDAKASPYYTGPVPFRDLLAGAASCMVLLALLVCNFAINWKSRGVWV